MIRAARRIGLRAVGPADFEVLDRIDFAADASRGWRYHGTGPSPGERVARMWGAGVLDQRLVTALATEEPIGYVTAYDHDPRSLSAWIGVAAAPEHLGDGLAVLGLGVFITHLFREWPLERLYAEATEAAAEQYRSASRMRMEEVGRFADARRRGDGFQDLVWYEITRASWRETEVELLPMIDWDDRSPG